VAQSGPTNGFDGQRCGLWRSDGWLAGWLTDSGALAAQILLGTDKRSHVERAGQCVRMLVHVHGGSRNFVPIMPLLANLTRLPTVSATLKNFHGLDIPAGYELPQHLWDALTRNDIVHYAWVELVVKAAAVFETGAVYTQLVNNRAGWLFAEEPQATVLGELSWPQVQHLDLLLRTCAVTGWDVEYHRARSALRSALMAFKEVLEEGVFMAGAKTLCPSGPAREALQQWYDAAVGEMVDEADSWLQSSFTWWNTLTEIAEKYPQVRIWADVLETTNQRSRRSGGVVLKRKQVFELRFGSFTPLRRLAWVSDNLARRVDDHEIGFGPVMS